MMKIYRTDRSLILSAFLLISLVAGPILAADDGGNVFEDEVTKGVWSVLGPNGGDVRSIVVDPRDKDRLYISTMDGQIHTSTDGGRTWRLLASFGKSLLTLDQLLVDSRDSKVLYASGHRGKLPGGFFKSTDGGVTWKESKDLREQAIHAMTQAKADPDVLYVGTKDGIWMSKDSGDDWKRIESGTMPLDINSFAVDPKNLSTLYAGTTWRPYKSTDSGKNWRLIKTGMIDDSDIFAITIDKENNDHLIASACSGIYESTNGGENWRKIQGIPSQSRRTRDIVQHPSRPGTLYAGTTEGFWMSVNGGKSWSLTTSRNIEVNKIAVHPDAPDRVYIATNNFGVLVSTDGGRNFAPTNDSFTSRFTYSVTPDVELPDRLYATTKNTSSSGGFFFYSEDGGSNWLQAKGLDIEKDTPFVVLQDKLNPTLMYLGASRGVFKSVDRGETWSLVTAPKPVRKAPVRRARRGAKAKPAVKVPAEAGPTLVPALTETVKVLAFAGDDKNAILAGTDKGLYRSYDIAKGWEKLSFGEGLDENIFAIHTTPNVPGTIWAGTSRSGVVVSTDDGKTWSKTNSSPDGIPVSSIASDPKRPNYLYVGTIQAFYLSRDGGRTWNRRGGNLPLGNFTSILIDPNNTDTIILSSALENEGGIYISEDAGMKWKRFDSKELKLPSRRIWSLVFDPQDPKRMYAGTHSSGVYRIDRPVETAANDAPAKEGN
ncbi:MAG: WD40/YVTN/BNR-like repeat-containing protein [Pyrinomonadaceae bacterium]